MNSQLKAILALLQQNENLTEADKEALLKALADADKQWSITDFKLDHTEKVKKTTEVLLEETIQELQRKTRAVEEKNQELAVESSLERVRTVAMGMTKPDDLLNICQAIYKELSALGFEQIRNGILHTFDDDEKFLTDYDYSDVTPGVITKIPYFGNPVIDSFLAQIRRSDNAFAEIVLQGRELDDWKKFRKKGGQPDDPRLDKTNSLYYYIYSVGQASIGISTFGEISEVQKDLLKRFRNVFDFAYRRYTDVAKAVAQAREAKIEAALEKVRSRSLAMHKSDELQEVVHTVFENLNELDVELYTAIIFIFTDGSKDIVWWLANKASQQYARILVPYADTNYLRDIFEAREKGKEFFSATYSTEEKNHLFRHLFENTEFRNVPEKQKRFLLESELATMSVALAKYTGINITSYTKKAFSEKENEILKRFANVFDQAHTRFLDLQKAEVQAKEAQVEAALERVRSRALAMHGSGELKEVVLELRKQMGAIAQRDLEVCAIHLYDESPDYFESWAAVPVLEERGKVIEVSARFPKRGLKIVDEMLAQYHAGAKDYILINEGDKVAEWFEQLKEKVPLGYELIVQNLNGAPPEKTRAYWSMADFPGGSLVMTTFVPPEEEARQLLRRFANVFGMAYQRFTDLKKAEAQAREAQIQLALERVRARTMAMHKSDELSDVATLLFKQVEELGIGAWTTGFNVWSDDNNFYTDFMTSPQGGFIEPYTIDAREYKVFSEVSEAKKRGDDFYVHYEEGETLRETYRQLSKFGEKQFEKMLEGGFQFPAHQYEHFVFGSKVSLMFITYEPVPEAHDIFKRFGKVFEQTYTRFLDLQTAEAQARESQVQLALERVRARTMAMQRSEELAEVATVLFQQVKSLGISQWVCGFSIFEIDDKECTWYPGSPDGDILPPCKIPLNEHPVFIAYNESRKRGDELFVYEKEGEFQAQHYRYMATIPCMRDLLQNMLDAGLSIPSFQIDHIANFSHGNLVFITYEHFPEMHDIFKRFAKVFEQTYTRFLDLQKAEAQAREAKIEASLERVRSKAMAMHKTDDLRLAVEIVFEELDKLNLGLIRCGIAILDKEKPRGDVWMTIKTDQDRTLQVSGGEPMDIHPLLQGAYDDWLKQKDRSYVLEGEDLTSYYQLLGKTNFQRPILASLDVQKKDLKQYHFNAVFGDGALFAFLNTPFSEEAKKVMKRFANVFDLTYKRFLDLQKAEAQAREAKIEASLERVRSKTMAMHTTGDVADTVATMFDELLKLGIETMRCGVGIMHENYQMELWTAKPNENGQIELIIGWLDMKIHPLLTGAYHGWKNKQDTYSYELFDDDLVKYYTAINEHADYPIKYNISSLPVRVFHNQFYFAEGTLFAFSAKQLPADVLQIFKRFAGIFGQTYRRYLDLRKAEAQAREAKIEASLERVRSKAMAMHNSQDLADTIGVFYRELQAFSFIPIRCGVGLLDNKERIGELFTWNTTEQGESLELVGLLRMEGHHVLEAVYENWLTQTEYHPVLRGNEIKEYYKVLRPQIAFPDYGHDEVQYGYFFFFAEGGVYAWTEKEMSEDELQIYRRFTSVLSLTYKRYKDLKLAEAQAREAQVEASLERVRAKTMAMHDSRDVTSATETMFEEFKKLGFDNLRCGIANIHQNRTFDVFGVTNLAGGSTMSGFGLFGMDEHPIWQRWFDSWQNKEEVFIAYIAGLEKEEYFKNINDHSNYLPQKIIQFPDNYFQAYYFEQGAVWTYSLRQHSESEKEIMKRFATVFSLTFRRYQDLKKAEAQTREAQIEAALERVRARAMAMHRTEDLNPAVAIVFEELEKLKLGVLRCGISVLDKEKRTGDVWVTSTDETGSAVQVSGDEPFDIHPLLQGAFNAWLRQEDFYYILERDDLVAYYRAVKAARFQLPESQFTGEIENRQQHCFVAVYHAGGLFAFQESAFSEEAKKVMKRFAAVFDLTYRRFHDLQRAEAQAREAKIEAAMEKVRARAMAMQKPGELTEVAELLRKEMGLLGVEELETSSIYIHDEATGKTECWYAIMKKDEDEKKLVSDYMTIDLNATSVGRLMLEFYYADIKQISIPMQGAARKEWINYCADHSSVLVGFYGDTIPDRTYHLYKFSNGYMGAASPGDISEESWGLLQRATSVFSLAYTRFTDLQIAEAGAREAIKQAALDRIRADIASMRTVTDLDRITPLIWNELAILGIPFIRCGVFIMDETQQLIHTYLSTPDGKAIAAFHLPFDTPGNLSKVLAHWKGNSIYMDHWDKSSFAELADILVKQGAIASPGQYLDSIPRDGFYLHFLPFLQGMLYVGNTDPLSEENMQLIQHVADAFSTAYARYEDFTKLEAAKIQIENTLVDLRQAQTQLIQSEKMASLGELTAGIAHEIQNPLNFVNNFSDVSNELIGEMMEEMAKGDIRAAKEIAESISQNLEKITHHGKRADIIVKGMLQHSRTSSGQKEPTDINNLADEYLRLAYHGLRAKDKTFNAKFETEFDSSIGKISVIPQDIGRVILNLINNAFYAVSEKKKQLQHNFEPIVKITTSKNNGSVEIRVKDNGNGIPTTLLDKIFHPFFTTKPTGQGTGLGLSLSYDIVRAHGGEIIVNTREKEGSEFIIQLPISNTTGK